MMVYAVLKGWYSDRHIVGIVESEEEAKELCRMFNKETRYDSDSVSYEEYDTKKFADKRFRFIVNDYCGFGDWECEYDDYDSATSVGLGASVQGASGYVWESGKYYVIGNIYASRSDAESVIDNLSESSYNVQIFEIKLKKIKISFGDMENKNVKIIKDSLSLYDDIYEALYDYSVKFDRKVYNNLAVCSYMTDLRGRVKSSISALQNISNQNEKILIIIGGLIKIDTILDQLILQTMENKGTNYQLKYGISSVVRIQYETYNKL